MKTKKNIVQKTVNAKNKKNEFPFYRLIIMGDSGVGKTQIINIYNKKIFQKEHFPTFCIDFQIKAINISGKKTNIHCIDTEGSKDFSENTGQSFIKKADAFILVYDITSIDSFINLDKYYNIFKFSLNDTEKKYPKKIIYFVGNKHDLKEDRVISEYQARERASKFNAKYIECSARNGFNIDRLFEYVIQDILRRGNIIYSDNKGSITNNSIYRNIMSIKSTDSLKNNNRNGIYTENESKQNFETSNYLLRNGTFINKNNGYINNINYQFNPNNEEYQNVYDIYQKRKKSSSKCQIF